MQSKSLLFVFMVCLCNCIVAQNTRAVIKNIKVNSENNIIKVSYDIAKSSLKETYKTRLYFNTEKGLKIVPASVSGDINNYVKGGKNKTVTWDVLKDTTELSGSITPTVYIEDNTEKLGGPFNAFYSLLLPGIGDYKVRSNASIRKCFYKPYFTTILAYGLVGYGVYQKIQSDKYYDKYLNTWSQSEIDKYYSKANNSHKQYIIAVGAAATIWLADFTYVLCKGIINKKNNKKNTALNKGGLYFNCGPYGLQAGYCLKF